MKKRSALSLILFCLIFFTNQLNAQDYPVNFNKENLQNYFEGNDLWDYMAAAFEASVKQIETPAGKTPFVLVDMDGEEIWLSCYFEPSEVELKVGDKIKAFGYFKHGNGRGKTQNEMNDLGFYLITAGLYNVSEETFVCSEHAGEQCDEWRYDGVFPERRP